MNKFWQKAKLKCKQWLPSEEVIRHHPSLHFLSRYLQNTQLWRLDGYTVPRAFLIGLFVACMPIPFQMALAGVLAIVFRANVLFAIGLVWVSNPFTWVPMIYAAYHLGVWALRVPEQPNLAWNTHTLLHHLNGLWQPLLVGSVAEGLLLGLLGYFITKVIFLILDRRKPS
jgi:uncharacterized protein (DUF2062 family)